VAELRSRLSDAGAFYLAGAVVVIWAQFVPLLNLLGYEYATLVCVWLGAALPHRVVARHRGDCDAWTLFARACRDGLGFVLLAAAISLLNAVRVRNCEIDVGFAYLGVFAVLGILPAGALGVAAAALPISRRARHAFAAAIQLSSVVVPIVFLATQPPIVGYGVFVGYFAGSIYDESLIGFGGHFAFRVYTSAFALAVVALVAWGSDRRRRDLALTVVGLLVCIGVFVYRGELGIERNRAYISEELGGVTLTEHFEIHYDAGFFDDRQLELMRYDHEARFAELRELYGAAPEGRLVSFIYGSSERRGDLMGGRRTLIAKVWIGEMHITWDGVGDPMLAHEMAHLFLRDHGYGPMRLASRDGLVPLMALVEGAAGAAEWGGPELDDHAWSAAMYRLEMGEDLRDGLTPAGYWGRSSNRMYTLTASFVRWLLDTRGKDQFLAAYRRGDFEGAYGQSLDEMIAQWRAFLDAYPLDEGMLEEARAIFDRPTMFARRCARTNATRLERGQRFIGRRDAEAARQCFDQLVADDPDDMRSRAAIAEAFAGAGLDADAHEHATAVAEAEGAGQARRARARELLADIAWRSGDASAAVAQWSALLGEMSSTSDRRRLQAKLAAAEAVGARSAAGDAMVRYLLARPAPSTTAVVAELVAAGLNVGDPRAAYLAGLRLASTDSPIVGELLREDVLAQLSPEQSSYGRERRAYWATLRGDIAPACADWEAVAAHARAGTQQAADAAMWLGRCARGDMPRLDAP
jgi:hypothetical protein